MSLGEVGADEGQGGGTDQATRRREVVGPPTDEGAQHVDVTVEDTRVLGGVPTRQRRLPDAGWPVEVEKACHQRYPTTPRATARPAFSPEKMHPPRNVPSSAL